MMKDRGIHPRFAGKTVRVRSEVRSREIRIKLTAAAAGSVVWADEGLILEHRLSTAVVANCRLLIDVIPINQQVDEISEAIERGPWSYCEGPDQSQAVLLGLAEQRPSDRHPDMAAWLSGLHTHDCWGPELAPAALYGLRDSSGHNQTAWLRSLDEASRAALQGKPGPSTSPGQIRRAALRLSRTFYMLYAPSLPTNQGTQLRSETIVAAFACRALANDDAYTP